MAAGKPLWAGVAVDRVIDLIGRRIRLIDADGERGIGFQAADEAIGEAAIVAEHDAHLPGAALAEKDRREGMDRDDRVG